MFTLLICTHTGQTLHGVVDGLLNHMGLKLVISKSENTLFTNLIPLRVLAADDLSGILEQHLDGVWLETKLLYGSIIRCVEEFVVVVMLLNSC